MSLHLRLGVASDGDGRAQLIAFLREAVPFYEEPGGIRVRLLQRRDDSNEFLEIIEYESDEDYEADQRRVEDDPQMRSLIERWRELLTTPPEVENV